MAVWQSPSVWVSNIRFQSLFQQVSVAGNCMSLMALLVHARVVGFARIYLFKKY